MITLFDNFRTSAFRVGTRFKHWALTQNLNQKWNVVKLYIFGMCLCQLQRQMFLLGHTLHRVPAGLVRQALRSGPLSCQLKGEKNSLRLSWMNSFRMVWFRTFEVPEEYHALYPTEPPYWWGRSSLEDRIISHVTTLLSSKHPWNGHSKPISKI